MQSLHSAKAFERQSGIQDTAHLLEQRLTRSRQEALTVPDARGASRLLDGAAHDRRLLHTQITHACQLGVNRTRAVAVGTLTDADLLASNIARTCTPRHSAARQCFCPQSHQLQTLLPALGAFEPTARRLPVINTDMVDAIVSIAGAGVGSQVVVSGLGALAPDRLRSGTGGSAFLCQH